MRVAWGSFLHLLIAPGLIIFAPLSALGLTLEEAIALSLTRNERTRAADEQTRAAEALVAKAHSFLLPDLTLQGDYTRRSDVTERTGDELDFTSQSREALEGRVTVEQTIFDARAWPLVKQAQRTRDAARHAALDTKRRLAYETAESFLTVLSSEQVARAAAERLELARQNLNEIRVRFDAQLVGSNDVTRAELEVATAERELVQALGTARTVRLGLGHLLNTEIKDSLAVPLDLLSQATRPVAAVELALPQAAARRSDLQTERARAAALRAAAQEPLMRYVPDLNFTGSAWTTDESGTSGPAREWMLDLGLTWRLFDGGDREADRSARTALARAADLNLQNLERGLAVDIEAARVDLESEQASLTQAEAAVAAARRNATESGELYRRGLARALEVVDANVQLFEAEVERARAQYALALALLNLRAAVGLDPLETEGEE